MCNDCKITLEQKQRLIRNLESAKARAYEFLQEIGDNHDEGDLFETTDALGNTIRIDFGYPKQPPKVNHVSLTDVIDFSGDIPLTLKNILTRS